MPAHPVSRLVRFTLAVGTNVIFDHLGYRRHRVGASRLQVFHHRRMNNLGVVQMRRVLGALDSQ